jgi:mRNA interferase RelE/StbE
MCLPTVREVEVTDVPARHHLEVTRRAARDLRKIDKQQRERLLEAMDRLVEIPPPGNLDIETISGHHPFIRFRVGEWRIIYRPLTAGEMRYLVLRDGTLSGPTGYLIERVVDRQYLERAVAKLELVELQ